MTLIITFGNCDHITQLSDRRLTYDGKLIEDESNKASILFCANGKLAIGFTGLAKAYEFETRSWLLKAIFDSSPPDYTAKNILERLTKKATIDFNNIPALLNTSRKNKRLSIIFSGYLYHHDPPLAVYAIMTNFQNFNNLPDEEARDNFNCKYWSEIRPNKDNFTLVQKIGFWTAFNDNDADQIRALLIKKVPPKATIDKSISIIREVADRRITNDCIGKQLSRITIHRDKTKPVESGYYPLFAKPETITPDIVYAYSNLHLTVENIRVEPVDPATTPPLTFPKIHKNHPCPCGSGKKYKHCHGKIRKRDNVIFKIEGKPS